MGEKRYGFSEKYRLKSKKRIDRLFRFGKRESCGYLRFRYLPSEQRYLKVVITVSKRVGSSPKRNRLKRLIREALRLSGFWERIPYDCGIYATEPLCQKATLTEIQAYVGQFIASLPR